MEKLKNSAYYITLVLFIWIFSEYHNFKVPSKRETPEDKSSLEKFDNKTTLLLLFELLNSISFSYLKNVFE